jgi:pimeloyl-ACP methyl ester carboxylesterase
MPRYAAALASVVNEIGPVRAIITHSFGGAAASLAISQGLEAARLVAISPPADALEWFRKFTLALALPPRVASAARANVERQVRASFDGLNAAAIGPNVRLPVLVIHDRDDKEVPWTDGAAVASASPDAELFLTTGLGHRRILLDEAVITRAVAFVAGGVEQRPADDDWDIETDLRDRARRWALGTSIGSRVGPLRRSTSVRSIGAAR